MRFHSPRWLGAAAVCVLAVAPAATPADNHEPFELFQKVVPVFTHDRCANCHGGVDPFTEGPGPTGEEHEGGTIGSPGDDRRLHANSCGAASCHDSSDKIKQLWITPGRPLSFHDKDAMALCKMQAHEVQHMTAGGYMHHLEDDVLIQDAFTGLVGGARGTAPPVKPSMDYEEFKTTMKSWLDAGAVCGSWTGEIKRVESFESDYSYTQGGSTTTVHERASRTFTVGRRDGRATATIDVKGNQTMIVVTNFGSCSTTLTSNSSWEGKPLSDTAAKARIVFEDANTYSIHVRGPPETIVTRGTSSLATDCPLPATPSEPAEPQEIPYKPDRFSIRCTRNTVPGGGTCSVEIDGEPPQLDGRYQRTINDHSDAADPQTWLSRSIAGISRSDNGKSLPVQVTTTWNLKVVE